MIGKPPHRRYQSTRPTTAATQSPQSHLLKAIYVHRVFLHFFVSPPMGLLRMQRVKDQQLSKSTKPATIRASAQSGVLPAVQRRLRDRPSLLNDRNPVMANTRLHVAAGHNSVEVVKFLLNITGPEKVELEAMNMEERRRKEAEAQLDMLLAKRVSHTKLARALSAELDVVDKNLKDLREVLLKSCRKMSTEEKKALMTVLTQLSPEDLNKALLIVAQNNLNFQATGQEVDLDIVARE